MRKVGKLLHLDIEPEPDGLIENSKETVDYFNRWLIPFGTNQLCTELGITPQEAEAHYQKTYHYLLRCLSFCGGL